MSASDQGIAGAVCGKWMPRKKAHARKYELARAYLDSPPAQLAVLAAA
jgi:hypothetical protein